MYSVNQVNQLYVINEVLTGKDHVTSASAAGTLEGPITGLNGDYIYFKYAGKGGVMATDRIKKCKVKWVSYTAASVMRKPMKAITITLNANVNSGNVVAGEDYILSFDFKNYFGMSDEDQYFKQAAARAFSSGNAAFDNSRMLANLAISLAKNMSREVDQPFTIHAVGTGTGMTGPGKVVTRFTKESDLHTSDPNALTPLRTTSIILFENEQPWELGRLKQTRPDFTVNQVPITISNIEYRDWANITVTLSSTSNAADCICNGKETADLEWFCMGERGDQYRGKDWPLSISTPANLMVDPSKEYNYVIIHFWDDIDNEGPQKSERDMTLVAATDSGVGLKALAASIAQAGGLDTYIVREGGVTDGPTPVE